MLKMSKLYDYGKVTFYRSADRLFLISVDYTVGVQCARELTMVQRVYSILFKNRYDGFWIDQVKL